MNVTLRCECGEPVSVTERAAGLRFPCRCGRSITVPPLGRLRELAGEPAIPPDPVAEVVYALTAGHLPPKACVGCGRGDADLIELAAVCERRYRARAEGESGPPLFSFLLFGWAGMLVTCLFRRQTADLEWHGRETVVPMPLPVCDTCRGDYGVQGLLALRRRAGWRRLLARVPAYDAVLKKYPDAELKLRRRGECEENRQAS
jgi:hypothetical protein